MKKYTRQRLILDLIDEYQIHTQEELSEYLEKWSEGNTGYDFEILKNYVSQK